MITMHGAKFGARWSRADTTISEIVLSKDGAFEVHVAR